MTRTQNHANPVSAAAGDTREGYFYALSAYILWGGLPFYMKAVAHIPPAEVVAHRILWSVPLAGLFCSGSAAPRISAALRSPKALAQSGLAAAFITVNWGIYVWAIGAGRALETALGYYINPLFSIFLGASAARRAPAPARRSLPLFWRRLLSAYWRSRRAAFRSWRSD